MFMSMNLMIIGISFFCLTWQQARTFETIRDCLRNPSQNVDATKLGNWQTGSKNLSFYFNNDGLNWCQTYHLCQKYNGQMIDLHQGDNSDDLFQASFPAHGWKNSNAGNSKTLMFVAGTRKDFGASWTWTEETPRDFDPNDSSCDHTQLSKTGASYASVFYGGRRTCELHHNKEYLEHFFCYQGPGNTTSHEQISTWFEAQTFCAYNGGRLATVQEIGGSESLNIQKNWIGLYRHPWIWLSQGRSGLTKYLPIKKFPPGFRDKGDSTMGPGRAPDTRDCLAVQRDSYDIWEVVPCSTRLNNIVCEESKQLPDTTLAPTASTSIDTTANEPERSTHTADDGAESDSTKHFQNLTWYLVIVGVGSLIACVIISFFAVGLKMGRGRSQQHQPSGPAHEVENMTPNVPTVSGPDAGDYLDTHTTIPVHHRHSEGRRSEHSEEGYSDYDSIRESFMYLMPSKTSLTAPDVFITERYSENLERFWQIDLSNLEHVSAFDTTKKTKSTAGGDTAIVNNPVPTLGSGGEYTNKAFTEATIENTTDCMVTYANVRTDIKSVYLLTSQI